jgi:integrase/recombinase XerD
MKIDLTLWNTNTKKGYPIKVRITNNGKYTYINTDVFIPKALWNNKTKTIRANHKEADKLNGIIQDKLSEAKSQKGFYSKGDVLSFTDEYTKHLIAVKQFGTYKVVKVVYKGLKNYIEDELKLKDISWKELDTDFLKKWQAYLVDERDLNNATLKNYFKKLRQVWNRARMENTHNLPDPFISIKLKENEVKHKGLTEYQFSELERIRLTQPDIMTPEYIALDTFMFQYYTLGMRIGDVLILKWKNIQGKKLVYKMRKTNKDIILPIGEQLLTILWRYFPIKNRFMAPLEIEVVKNMKEIGNDYILPYMSKDIKENTIEYYNYISSKTAIVNRDLKYIGATLNIDKLTSHQARHTFASTMIRKGANAKQIQQSLGHANLNLTQLYINSFTEEELDTVILNVYDDAALTIPRERIERNI